MRETRVAVFLEGRLGKLAVWSKREGQLSILDGGGGKHWRRSQPPIVVIDEIIEQTG